MNSTITLDGSAATVDRPIHITLHERDAMDQDLGFATFSATVNGKALDAEDVHESEGEIKAYARKVATEYLRQRGLPTEGADAEVQVKAVRQDIEKILADEPRREMPDGDMGGGDPPRATKSPPPTPDDDDTDDADSDEHPAHDLIVTNLADVDPVDREWLWQNRIPLGCITGVVGNPGEGKSVITLDWAARISTGRDWPDGTACEQGKVLLVSSEDEIACDLVPRLMVHDADRSMIQHVITAVDRADGAEVQRMLTLRDVDRIGKLLAGGEYRAVIIDPIGSFIGGGTDAHRDNEVRAVLAPLAEMAARYRVAAIVVMHTRKSPGERADDMALGSRAFVGIARAIWHVFTDPDDPDRRLVLPGKNNHAKKSGGLACKLVGAVPDGMDEQKPLVKWEGTVAISADEHLASTRTGPGPDPEARKEAEHWLIELLREHEREVGDEKKKPADGTIRAEAKAAGISWATVRRAKDNLAAKGVVIRSEKNTFTKRYQWRIVATEPLAAAA